MNILFLTILDICDFKQKNLYVDLINQFIKNGDSVKVVCPTGGKLDERTNYSSYENNSGILRVKTQKLQKINIIKKGIATLLLESQLKKAIKNYFSDVKFDLILYSTPPITFAGVISYIKKRDNAKTYLLLKDIFPQNAVDIGMMTKSGPKSVIYKIFRKKEEQLYKISDYIGCMSQANVDFIIKNNPYINPEKVHINPNSIEIEDELISDVRKAELREKYGIPQNVTTFIYGGNLGKPQDIPFIIECLKDNTNKEDRFFVICGTGTEYPKLKAYMSEYNPKNVLLLNGLPRTEYEEFTKAFDVGLIFLDCRFTIPNFPSRLLSYMQNHMPVLACTDINTDIGKTITEGEFGWWCESNNTEGFTKMIEETLNADLKAMGENGFKWLKNNFSVEKSYEIIKNSIEG